MDRAATSKTFVCCLTYGGRTVKPDGFPIPNSQRASWECWLGRIPYCCRLRISRPQNTYARHTMHAASLPHRDEDRSNIFSSFSNLRPDSTSLDRGGDFFPCGFSPAPCIKQWIYFTWCNGWPMVLVTRAHSLSKLAFRGGVRIINPPLSKFGHMSKSGVMSKLGVHPVYL